MQGPPRDVPRQEQQILFGYTIVGQNGIIRSPEQVITLYPGEQSSIISLGPDESIQGYSVTNSPGQTFFMSITPRMTPSPLPPQPPVVQPPVIQPPVVQPPVIQPLRPPTVPQIPPTTSGRPSVPGQPPSTLYTPSGSIIPWAVWAIGQTNPNIGRVSPERFLYPYRGGKPGQAGTSGTGQTGGQLPPGVGLGVSPPWTGVFNGRFYPSTFRPSPSGATGVFGSRQPSQTYPTGTPYYSTRGEYYHIVKMTLFRRAHSWIIIRSECILLLVKMYVFAIVFEVQGFAPWNLQCV